MSTPEDEQRTNSWLRFSHLGLQYCVTLLLGIWAGSWLDGRLGTEPWLLIAGSLLGMGLSTYLLVRATARIGR